MYTSSSGHCDWCRTQQAYFCVVFLLRTAIKCRQRNTFKWATAALLYIPPLPLFFWPHKTGVITLQIKTCMNITLLPSNLKTREVLHLKLNARPHGVIQSALSWKQYFCRLNKTHPPWTIPWFTVPRCPSIYHQSPSAPWMYSLPLKTITLLTHTSLHWTRVAMDKWQKQEREGRYRESWMIKDGQCMYNVTLRRVRVATVTVEKQ